MSKKRSPSIDQAEPAETIVIENAGGPLSAVPELKLAPWPTGERRTFDGVSAEIIMTALAKRGLKTVEER